MEDERRRSNSGRVELGGQKAKSSLDYKHEEEDVLITEGGAGQYKGDRISAKDNNGNDIDIITHSMDEDTYFFAFVNKRPVTSHRCEVDWSGRKPIKYFPAIARSKWDTAWAYETLQEVIDAAEKVSKRIKKRRC